MKVKDLINLLYKQNPEHEVFVLGYEGGLDNVESIHPCKVLLNYYNEWYMGKHEEVDDALTEEHTKGYEQVSGIYISSLKRGKS